LSGPPVLALAGAELSEARSENAIQEESGTKQILPEQSDFHKAILAGPKLVGDLFSRG
jgi:hypothetical protein